MRVLAGDLRGRRLVAPGDDRTRPTAARVREALFDVLAPLYPGGGAVLDLYAGSGALGIEALSRGFARACFVERGPVALRALRHNLRTLGVEDRATVVSGDVGRFLDSPRATSEHFDLVLADPPYALGAAALVGRLGRSAAGPASGLLAVEHLAREELPPDSGNLERIWSRTYGGTGLSIYRWRWAGT